MAQLALYRKYRSQTFDDLVGQSHVVKTLQSAISTGRIAHAFLFTGPRGTGKTSSARLLAKALNCESGPTANPCNSCYACNMITEGSHPDVLEMDAASESGVDDVRERIVEVASYAPMMAPYKVFIIDEVHDLSAKAFDALLKTIEEPPAHIIFILATTEFTKVPATIRSRCQKYEFHRATVTDLSNRLQHVLAGEGLSAEPAAINAIARMADGGYRDALTLLEQAILVSDGPISVQAVYDQLGLVPESVIDEMLDAMKLHDVGKVIETIDMIVDSGRDPRALVESLLYRLAELTRVGYQVKSGNSEAPRESALHEFCLRLGKTWIIETRSRLAEAHKVIRDISLPRLWLESELIQLAVASRSAIPNSATRTTTMTTVAATPATVVVREVGKSPVSPAAESKEDPPTPAESAPASVAASAVVAPEVAVVPNGVVVPEGGAATKPILDEVSPTKSHNAQHSRVQTGGTAWEQLLELVPDQNPKTGGPVIIKKKLAGATLIREEGTTLFVGIPGKMNFDWLTENPARMGYLAQFLPEVDRKGWNIKLVLDKAESPVIGESDAVELPIEGERLVQVAKAVFQAGDAGALPD